MSRPPPPTEFQELNRPKLACLLCARRKVKCDKGDPCSNCLKAEAKCLYEGPTPNRPRKRAADEELLTRIAQYEDLLREHNIEFEPYTHTWIHSNLDASDADKREANKVLCLWSTLPLELQYPPTQTLGHKDDPLLYPAISLQSVLSDNHTELHELHPEPRHIYRFWQMFVERINPMTKIVHVPTLQQRVLDVSWDPRNAAKPLAAILFAIYTIAVTSTTSDECQALFDETRGSLLTRYRAATLRALMEADFLTTRNLEVLQALVLFLFSNPRSELSTTLTGAAIRIADKMGLQQESTDPRITFFEKEMRIRLWWQLRGLDARCRIASTPGIKKPPPPSEIGDIRLPLNVNDADLHPNMTEPPLEHNGPTEMMCVLMKLEVSNWCRHSPNAAKLFENVLQNQVGNKASINLQSKVVNELQAIYYQKYFINSDTRIPLHRLTLNIANISIARLRFAIYHPRARATKEDTDVYIVEKESDILFESALTWLEAMADVRRCNTFSPHLFAHMTTDSQLDAYIYLISELRQRCSGERVLKAWNLVEKLYNEHPELIRDTNEFFVAFGNLTLEAWGARKLRETPPFIQSLWDVRQYELPECGHLHPFSNPDGPQGLSLEDEKELNWVYWSDLLRL
ncbi:C6 zinc finger domain-containing protein [Aspergillus sclerotioniger CBS 115572]|uniref:C6 zinc finger domain-containing protein n=1 Tax=Aspergillus sclerotioniger CBS 115572 TaxID=1450535 RepID=A0A317V8C0_9EURO|nr:C6 zinc finger domain-containing protein [Aspergillus sclerotioniger CBS 115572]PWY69629.1 C6 zinc finger domain-containing protein [Aspergillus sclerotioniger CBS 115572]